MKETVKNDRKVIYSDTSKLIEIRELEKWFKTEYIQRNLETRRYKFLGLPLKETLYSLELEAYKKEQRLRELKGEKKLPDITINKVI